MEKVIKGFEKYSALSSGEIKNNITGRILKPNDLGHGYFQVTLVCENRKALLVHRLIAETFIPNPYNLSQVNHIDGNPSNNKLNNLEWVTPSQNIKHSYNIGRKSLSCSNHPSAKLDDYQVTVIKTLKGDLKSKHLANYFNVSRDTVNKIWSGKLWSSLI